MHVLDTPRTRTCKSFCIAEVSLRSRSASDLVLETDQNFCYILTTRARFQDFLRDISFLYQVKIANNVLRKSLLLGRNSSNVLFVRVFQRRRLLLLLRCHITVTLPPSLQDGDRTQNPKTQSALLTQTVDAQKGGGGRERRKEGIFSVLLRPDYLQRKKK